MTIGRYQRTNQTIVIIGRYQLSAHYRCISI